MIPFTVIVRHELRNGSSKVALPDRDHAIEALLLDRSHEAFDIGIRNRRPIGRQHGARVYTTDPILGPRRPSAE
jgi:hypothetical protein